MASSDSARDTRAFPKFVLCAACGLIRLCRWRVSSYECDSCHDAPEDSMGGDYDY